MAAETISTSAPAQPFPPAGAQVLAAPPAAALGTGPVMLSRSAIIRLMRPLMEAVDRMFGELSLQVRSAMTDHTSPPLHCSMLPCIKLLGYGIRSARVLPIEAL